MTVSDPIQEKLRHLPTRSGVYLMKGEGGEVIYVGKARSLRSRVRSYFNSDHAASLKTRELVRRIRDFETIVVGSEAEALILENNLIKEYQPRFNISLRDDKTYPYVKITVAEPFPRVLVTRKLVRDGSRLSGADRARASRSFSCSPTLCGKSPGRSFRAWQPPTQRNGPALRCSLIEGKQHSFHLRLIGLPGAELPRRLAKRRGFRPQRPRVSQLSVSATFHDGESIARAAFSWPGSDRRETGRYCAVWPPERR